MRASIGGNGGSSSATPGGDGNFIIGIHGLASNNGAMQSISPVTLTEVKSK